MSQNNGWESVVLRNKLGVLQVSLRDDIVVLTFVFLDPAREMIRRVEPLSRAVEAQLELMDLGSETPMTMQ